MKELSFFRNPGGAGNIRGNQIVEYLGAKLNPESGFDNDTCVYVKRFPPDDHPENSWFDVVDAWNAPPYLLKHPELGVISMGDLVHENLSTYLHRDDIVCIPHHHCNYERELREDREVKVVGIIGSRTAFQYDHHDFRKRLSDVGLELEYQVNHWRHYNNIPNEDGKDSREKVVRFHRKIDIQVAWRKKTWFQKEWDGMRCPLKLANAGSFGIPTVALPEPSWVKEWDGCFVEARTIDDMIFELVALKKDPGFYRFMSECAREKAEEYHIEHIAKRYVELCR